MSDTRKCIHGTIASQCRCPCDGTVTIVDCPPACPKKEERDTNASQS